MSEAKDLKPGLEGIVSFWSNGLDLTICYIRDVTEIHRGTEHFVSSKNKCTVIYLCSCVFFSRLKGISKCYFVCQLEL